MSSKYWNNVILVMLALIVCGLFSMYVSKNTYSTDFPVFYYAASTIVDPNTPNEAVYETGLVTKYNIPERMPPPLDFIYSMLVAYMMAPLALMPYYTAKAVMIFANILMYLGGVAIALHLGGAKGRAFIYPLAFSCLWMPFIQNLRFGQVNSILLFLVSVAVLAATKNRSTLCGILLGIAALFKLFPIAIAMVLGLKNWRIFTACIVVLGASFLVPDSLGWFPAISKIYTGGYTPIYLWLKGFGSPWFFCYAGAIAVTTALIVHQAKHASAPLLVSFAIPAMFLTMPITGSCRLTILVFAYAYLWSASRKSNKLLMMSIFVSMTMIYSSFLVSISFSVVNGLFLIWVALACQLVSVDTDLERKPTHTVQTN